MRILISHGLIFAAGINFGYFGLTDAKLYGSAWGMVMLMAGVVLVISDLIEEGK